jgi:hypothetical protein
VIGSLALAALLVLTGCSRSSRPVAPPEPDPLAEAEAAYDAGDWTSANSAYRSILDEPAPDAGASRERALYRLALIHALPQSPLHNTATATGFLVRLTSEFPTVSGAREVRALISLQTEIGSLQTEIGSFQTEIDNLKSTIASQQDEIANSEATAEAHELAIDERNQILAERALEIEQLRMRLAEVEAQLNTLRQIDLGRRPAPRPDN